MNDNQLLIDPFLDKWKDKYPITWCDLCDTAIIICPECHNSSCNGGGCNKCINDPDAKEFSECKTHIWNYLTEDEKIIHEKGLRIKKHILETLSRGEKHIDWKLLRERGELSQHEEELLKSFLD